MWAMNKIRIVKKWARFALEAAPAIISLRRSSHPIAWIAAGLHVLDKASGLSISKPPTVMCTPWPSLHWSQRQALVEAFVQAGIGECVTCSDASIPVFRCGGVTFGTHGGVMEGPEIEPGGDPDAPIDALWGVYASLTISSPGPDRVGLSADPGRDVQPPSRRVCKIAEDCVALRNAGLGVGVLLDGPPGSGKSQALLHIAAALGGRTLRAPLGHVKEGDLHALVAVLKPDAVILDDIDRAPTSGLLDTVDLLMSRGIAILASANDSRNICDALVRENRIDDHHVFGAIEPDVLERLAPRLQGEDMATLSTLTVAAVTRYLSIRDTLGRERGLTFLRSQIDSGQSR